MVKYIKSVIFVNWAIGWRWSKIVVLGIICQKGLVVSGIIYQKRLNFYVYFIILFIQYMLTFVIINIISSSSSKLVSSPFRNLITNPYYDIHFFLIFNPSTSCVRKRDCVCVFLSNKSRATVLSKSRKRGKSLTTSQVATGIQLWTM